MIVDDCKTANSSLEKWASYVRWRIYDDCDANCSITCEAMRFLEDDIEVDDDSEERWSCDGVFTDESSEWETVRLADDDWHRLCTALEALRADDDEDCEEQNSCPDF